MASMSHEIVIYGFIRSVGPNQPSVADIVSHNRCALESINYGEYPL